MGFLWMPEDLVRMMMFVAFVQVYFFAALVRIEEKFPGTRTNISGSFGIFQDPPVPPPPRIENDSLTSQDNFSDSAHLWRPNIPDPSLISCGILQNPSKDPHDSESTQATHTHKNPTPTIRHRNTTPAETSGNPAGSPTGSQPFLPDPA